VLAVALRRTEITVDGKLDDWAGAQWALVDGRGTRAWFDSNAKPYNVQAAVAVWGEPGEDLWMLVARVIVILTK
jgi:hypothetical protein